MHLISLHVHGSNNPEGITSGSDRLRFHPYFTSKDLIGFLWLFILISLLIYFSPNYLGHPDNSIPANPQVTPASIVPEWYFRAPSNYYFPQCTHINYNIFMGIMTLSLIILTYNVQRAQLLHVISDDQVESAIESSVSDEGFHDKHERAIFDLAKLMNLIYDSGVSPRTFTPYLTTGNVNDDVFPENITHLRTERSTSNILLFESQGPVQKSGNNKNLGLPCSEKEILGNGGFVVGSKVNIRAEGNQTNLQKDNILMIPQGCENLLSLYKENCKDLKKLNKKQIFQVSDIKLLTSVTKLIKNKPINLESYLEKSNILIQNISNDLKSGKFKFKFRINPLNNNVQNINMLTPRVKIVLKAISLVQESIYESSFLAISHAFRPNKGTHSTQKMLDQRFKSANWFIQFDLPDLDIELLLKLQAKRIECEKTMALIRRFLKSKLFKFSSIASEGDNTILDKFNQGPILFNIYYHELDIFMENLKKKYDCGLGKRAQSPEYTFHMNQQAKAKKTNDINKIKEIRKSMRKIPRGQVSNDYVRIHYLRYANSAIISVIGKYGLSREILEDVKIFLKNDQNILQDENNIKITNVKLKSAFFLDTEIKTGKYADKPIVKTKLGKKVRVTPRISQHAPIKELQKELKVKGFQKSDNLNFISSSQTLLVNLTHSDIILFYNKLISSILTYYSFADNKANMGSIIRQQYRSCALTLALKYKLRFASKVFKKYGSQLKDPKSDIKLVKPFLKRTRIFSIKSPLVLGKLPKTWVKFSVSNTN